MKQQRKTSAGSGGSATNDLNRKINALVLLLEEKGLLETGEFEDSLMNLKIQLGDQMPQLSRPPKSNSRPQKGGGRPQKGGGRPQKTKDGGEYIGPERRREARGERVSGGDRRGKTRTAVTHISGDVHNEESGTVISGVQLILRRSTEESPPIQFRSTKTDLQGRFVFLNLPMHTDAEPIQPYSYQLEVRYRNRTLHMIRDFPLHPDQTSQHHIRLQIVEA